MIGKRLITFGLLSSLALLLFAAVPVYSQYGDAVVMIDQSVGGTSNPGPGVHLFPAGIFVYLTAIPAPGYTFSYWQYLGPQFAQSQEIDPAHGGAQVTIFTTPTVQFDCAGGYTVEWIAVFTPM